MSELSFQINIGKEKAVAFSKTKWWEGQSARTIALVQMKIAELCCDFPVFHTALEEALGHPVFTHEMGIPEQMEHLYKELTGEAGPKTFDEVLALIPEEKRGPLVMVQE